MIVYPDQHCGLPHKLASKLEDITQETIQSLFDLAQQVYNDPTIELWNCSVERSVVKAEDRDYDHNRLVIVNHSCSYWAVIEFGQRNYPADKGAWDFWLFATSSKKLSPKRINWEKFTTEKAYGRTKMFWQASKSDGNSWYAPNYELSFKHPLFHLLNEGVQGKEVDEYIGEQLKIILMGKDNE